MSSWRGPRALFAALVVAVSIALLATAVQGDVTSTHDTVISFNSRITPRVLPRTGLAPVAIRIEGHVKARKSQEPAALTKIELAIHRAAKLSRRGLPVCDISSIDPASSSVAMATCGDAKIGYGRIKARSRFPGQPHFTFNGRAVIFNGRLEDGRPAIIIHVFHAHPPSSFVFPFVISHRGGRYGTILSADVHISRWSRITDFNLVLNRRFRYAGQRRSFLGASCPAPKGFTVGISPFVRVTLGFGDGTATSVSIVSSCQVAR